MNEKTVHLKSKKKLAVTLAILLSTANVTYFSENNRIFISPEETNIHGINIKDKDTYNKRALENNKKKHLIYKTKKLSFL